MSCMIRATKSWEEKRGQTHNLLAFTSSKLQQLGILWRMMALGLSCLCPDNVCLRVGSKHGCQGDILSVKKRHTALN